LNLSRDLWTQISSSAELDIKASYLSRVQQFHGPPDKELSLAAEISRLHDSFAALADSPEDAFLQSNTVNQSVDTAHKLNEFSRLITTLRNDAQGEMETTIERINDLINQIAELNVDVANSTAVGRTTAIVEDKRDDAIKALSELIDITFFQRGDGTLVVQTNQGVELASNRAAQLTFRPTPQYATTYYPFSAGGVYVGDPLVPNSGAIDITASGVGGKLGGLIELRDETFPKQMAQLDELAHKMALRMEAQGLRLFTDESGNIPADTAPDSIAGTAVPYVGFASRIQVNSDILADNSILQRGTYGATIATGSNEVIRRVLQYSFDSVEYQQAVGNIDLRVSGNAPPNDTLQDYLGVISENSVNGTRNLSSFLSAADYIAAADGALDPGSDTFRMTFEDTDLGLGPVNIDVSLAAVPDGAGNFVQDLITYINGTVIPALLPAEQAALADLDVTFSEGASGQLSVSTRGDITFDASVVTDGMGITGLATMGFAEGTTEAVDPYFDIQIGNNAPVRVTIAPGDDESDLMTKLLAVPGLAAEDLVTSTDGFLRIRPGNNYDDPDFGGDIKIIAGPFTADNAGAVAIPDGVNIASALFGSFSTPPLQDLSPIANVNYGSQTDGSIAPPIPTIQFRTDYLGPGANISTGIFSGTTILDYSQKMVNEQSQESILTEARRGDSASLKETLQRQLMDDSGVNIDEELAHLIQVQTAYTASARVISAINDLFDDLITAIR
jgi:flagellar hook-associated protein 1 FlgK